MKVSLEGDRINIAGAFLLDGKDNQGLKMSKQCIAA